MWCGFAEGDHTGLCQSVKKYILGKDETLVFVAGAMDMGVFSVEMRKWMDFVIFFAEKGRLM